MPRQRCSEALPLACGIAALVLPFVSMRSEANEGEHVRKQTEAMQLIEDLRDPQVTGSLSGSVAATSEVVWSDVTRVTPCQVRAGSLADRAIGVSACERLAPTPPARD
jgi:hypothetical protein